MGAALGGCVGVAVCLWRAALIVLHVACAAGAGVVLGAWRRVAAGQGTRVPWSAGHVHLLAPWLKDGERLQPRAGTLLHVSSFA